MLLKEKIRILRKNREWTQAQLADKLSLSPDAVQKWESGDNTPPLTTVQDLARVFETNVEILANDEIEVMSYYKIETIPAEELLTDVIYHNNLDSDHTLYDAHLHKGAVLHRFNNPAGVPYSAIYIGGHEIYSCERDHEKRMIDYWNEMH